MATGLNNIHDQRQFIERLTETIYWCRETGSPSEPRTSLRTCKPDPTDLRSQRHQVFSVSVERSRRLFSSAHCRRFRRASRAPRSPTSSARLSRDLSVPLEASCALLHAGLSADAVKLASEQPSKLRHALETGARERARADARDERGPGGARSDRADASSASGKRQMERVVGRDSLRERARDRRVRRLEPGRNQGLLGLMVC